MTFSGKLFFWRGPAPYHFVRVPKKQCAELAAAAKLVSYGWGMIPVEVTIGATRFTTALWPKDGGYIVPIKNAAREAETLALDDTVKLTLAIGVRARRRASGSTG